MDGVAGTWERLRAGERGLEVEEGWALRSTSLEKAKGEQALKDRAQ